MFVVSGFGRLSGGWPDPPPLMREIKTEDDTNASVTRLDAGAEPIRRVFAPSDARGQSLAPPTGSRISHSAELSHPDTDFINVIIIFRRESSLGRRMVFFRFN